VLEYNKMGVFVMVKIHLSRLLGERRLTQSDLARATGIRPSTINEWYHEIVPRLNVDHIDKICEALNCNLSDLVEYIPNENKQTGKKLIVEDHGNRKSIKKKK
jgi:putative transcriptional regulator